jgi:phosphoribosylaminoimidazolecarboxamide formyltransferase / IMP cyclohydrolase
MIRRALISVSDKSGLVELACSLAGLGIEIVSTGGTAAALQKAGLPVIHVSDVTGFPECLDGRVKTLHPKIHGGILAIRANPEHQARIKELGITLIDLVIINLYPFRKTILKPGVSMEECMENIDIGGPSMLRAAAKNYRDVTVLADPADYAAVLAEIAQTGDTTLQTRFYLARKVFEHTAAYDALIAGYFRRQSPEGDLPGKLTLTFDRKYSLRYGENPHQKAFFYEDALPVAGSLAQAEQLGGKELSYNNIADTDAALALLKEFSEPTVVAVKHANPCGVASASGLMEAWSKAYEADSVSIYGGIVAMNRTVDLAVAQATKGVFLEVFIAPDFTPEALENLQSRKNLRILRLPDASVPIPKDSLFLKHVTGALLVQDPDTELFNEESCLSVTDKKADDTLTDDLRFAMKVVKHVKSNAIVLAKNKQTVGIGPGQPNRITSVEIAIKNAGSRAEGAILASDAFFPFPDCVETAARGGITAIIQPGGSIRDQESIDACNRLGLIMLFTGMRHFRH